MMKLLIIALLATSALAIPFRHRNFQTRIVGGKPAKQGQFPYQLSFQYKDIGFHFCGASIYNEFTMICAGHCVAGEDMDNPRGLQIVAGDLRLSDNSGKEQARDVTRIVLHEDYDSFTISNDISLLFVDTPLEFNGNVESIALYEGDATGDAIVSGWGTLHSGGVSPDNLQYVEVPIVSDGECRDAYGESEIFDSMICAGIEGKDSCQGDSGGPMVCEKDGKTLQCGIVSWGYGCAQDGYPGVYTEVAYFVDWIETNAKRL